MSAEKTHYAVDHQIAAPSDNHDLKDIVRQKGGAVGEAADIYGDLQTAEQYGYVERG